MKQLFISLFFLLCFGLAAQAQAPQKFKYQAVARDMTDAPYAATNLRIRFFIIEDSDAGPIRYFEEHTVTTSNLGVFSANIGEGAVLSGNMSDVDWGNHPYFMRVELNPDPVGGTFSVMGTSQLLSVPYALYAGASGSGGGGATYTAGSGISISGNVITNTGDADASPTNELQTLSLSGQNLSLSNGGGTVTLPAPPTYTGGTGINISGQTITAVDASTTNELQNLSLAGNVLSISNGNSVTLPALSVSAGPGIAISGNVVSNTGDLDATNEIQSLSLSGNVLSLSNGGGAVTLPAGGSGDNWGAQSVQTNATLSGNGTAGSPLTIAQNGAVSGQTLKWNGSAWAPADDLTGGGGGGSYTAGSGISISGTVITNTGDADASPTNEIQSLSIAGNTLSLSNGGGSVSLPPATDAQTLSISGNNLSISNGNTVILPTGASYTGGTGISVTGTTITNTGDTNAADDLTTSSTAAGDVTGQFNNLQIAPNAVGTPEINNGAVTGDKIATTGASNGQVLKFNGSTWAPADDLTGGGGGGSYTAGSGISISGTVITNTGDTNPADDLTNSSTAAGDVTGQFNNLQIAPNAVGTPEIADAAITTAKIAQNGAANGQTLKWNGANWAPADDLTGGGGGGSYTAGSGISISGTVITNTGDADASPTNEIQSLSISGNTLSLSNGGGSVALPPATDAQTLSIAGNNLSISNGNTVALPTGATYTGGTGINITGTTINNTGDTNPADDLTTSSTAAGDVTGPFSNLQIAPNAVGTPEIANGAITGAKIAQNGATSGQLLAWNGSTWAPATPPSGGGDDLWDNTLLGPALAHNVDAVDNVLISRTPASSILASNVMLTVDAQDASTAARFTTTNTQELTNVVEITVDATAPSFTSKTALYIDNTPFLDSGNGIEIHAGGTGISIDGALQGIVANATLGAGGNFSGSTGVVAEGQGTGASGIALFQDHGSVGVRGTYAGNGSFNAVGIEGTSRPENATIAGDKGFGIGGRFLGGNKGVWADQDYNLNSTYLAIFNTYDSLYGSRNLPMAGYFRSKSSVGAFAESEGYHTMLSGNPDLNRSWGTGLVGVHKGDMFEGSSSVGVLGVAEASPSGFVADALKAGVMGYSSEAGFGINTGVYGFGDGCCGYGGLFKGDAGVVGQGRSVSFWGQASETGSAAWLENFAPDNTSDVVYIYNYGLTNAAALITNGNNDCTSNTLHVQNTGRFDASNAAVGQAAVHGVMTNADGGTWSAAVRGINQSTTGSGVGVIGMQNGSGFGVYAQTVGGRALMAQSETGWAGYFRTGSIGGNNPTLYVDGRMGVRTTNLGSYALRIKQGDGQYGLNLLNTTEESNWEIWSGSGADAVLNFTGGSYTAWIGSAGLITTSDQRFKKDWITLPSVLDGIKRLNPVSYEMNYENTGRRYTGFLAQELQREFPMLVEENDIHGEKRFGVNYGAVGVVAVKAIQEQQAIIEAQQRQIDEQEARLRALEAEMAELKKLLLEKK